MSGIYRWMILVVLCVTKISSTTPAVEYDFSDASKILKLQAGNMVHFDCAAQKSQTAVLKIGEQSVENKGLATSSVHITWKYHGKTVICAAKDENGQLVNEKKVHLNVEFPPMLAGHHIHHLYTVKMGAREHVTIHFLTNPPIPKHSVHLTEPHGTVTHHDVFQVAHQGHHPIDHIFLLAFQQVKEENLGHYTLNITSEHFPNHPLTFKFTVTDRDALVPHGSPGGVIAAVIFGVFFIIGLVGIMVFLVRRADKKGRDHEAHTPIVREEELPSTTDHGISDDVFIESRPGRSHIGSIGNSMM